MELTFEFRVPNIPLLNGQAQQVIDEELRAAVNSGLLIFKGQIQPLVPVGVTGQLRQGVSTSLAGEDVSLVGRVFDPVAYAMPVEAGSRPHFPPIGPIQLWVRRKLGISGERESRSVAFLVARAISRRGTPAREFFKRGFEAGKGQVLAIFEKSNARIAARLMGKA